MAEPNWVCVYCGLEEPDSRYRTRDHVPPKNSFPEPRPSDLITVPSCRSCNETASMDDEFFRLMVAGKLDAHDHPQAQEVFESIIRSFQRPQARGFSRQVLDNLIDVDMYLEGGVYIGQGVGYRVDRPDYDRLDLVTERMIRGLYWDKFTVRLPNSCTIKCYEIARLETKVDRKNLEDLGVIFKPMIERQPDATIGNGVFEYWVERAEDNDLGSAWILRFYKRVWFFGLTTPSST